VCFEVDWGIMNSLGGLTLSKDEFVFIIVKLSLQKYLFESNKETLLTLQSKLWNAPRKGISRGDIIDFDWFRRMQGRKIIERLFDLLLLV